MFCIAISAEAKAMLDALLQESGLERPGVMIARQGTKADVTRSADGEAVWAIEPPKSPWTVYTGSFATYPDSELQVVNGIAVHLALVPQDDEAGVVVRVKDGELFVEALDAQHNGRG